MAGTPLHTFLAYKIDIASEYALKLCSHSIHIEQGNACAFLKTHKNIHVTPRAKILPKRRSKYSQPNNPV